MKKEISYSQNPEQKLTKTKSETLINSDESNINENNENNRNNNNHLTYQMKIYKKK